MDKHLDTLFTRLDRIVAIGIYDPTSVNGLFYFTFGLCFSDIFVLINNVE